MMKFLKFSLLFLIMTLLLSFFVLADYEDGVECEYCGAWRYDDWKCDDGDHCGQDSDGSCYEDHHCGNCGACQNDVEYICDCGNGCSECSVICSECSGKCESCADDELCGSCGVCWGCIGGEGNYCEECGLCKNCVDTVCICGKGCSECATICIECGEKCEACADDELCGDCGVCWGCIGGEGNYCEECGLCKNCVDMVCICGKGCSECATICAECGEKCEACADDELCTVCGICWECIGGEGNYCEECGVCKNCVEAICSCGHGCSECATVCPECSEKCSNCSDESICGGCNVCKDCVGGDGNFCDSCDTCINCAEYVCYCGQGCSECATVCPECTEKCTSCADEDICGGCNVCKDCVGGDGNFCDNCDTCINCAEYVCSCGEGCSECATVCPECAEKCTSCADEDICGGCNVCKDCVGGDGNFCENCETCINCAEYVCYCGQGCSECAIVCPECNEACENCSDELCVSCGKCVSCSEADGWCGNCMLCADCTVTCVCGNACVECNDLCEECLEHCPECYDDFCISCYLCRECVGEDHWCEECGTCGECTDICSDCGLICLDCAESFCDGCGVCSECKSEFCPDCGICSDCADAMCRECYYCSDCAPALCVKCEEYCSSCVTFCEECESCEHCAEFCAFCEKCTDCCAEYSEHLGCEHGICSMSREWKKHYCTEGEHCIEKTELGSDEDYHWYVCADGCDVRLDETAHLWGNARIKQEATSDKEGILALSCSVCGYEKEESIPKLSKGHTHSYTNETVEPTCNNGGYTTHTCSCGHTWTDGVTDRLEHKYVIGYSEAEHFMRCENCNDMQKNQSHTMGKWTVIKKAGYTFEGIRERKCTKCDYSFSEPIPMLEPPESKAVISLPITVKTADSDSKGTNEENGKAAVEAELSDTDVTEILTSGSEKRVPTLPQLPPNDDGAFFDGWADKKTGLMVSKGDKILESIELVPLWKDCGEGNHTPNEDGKSCSECGKKLSEKPSADASDSGKDIEDNSGMNDTAPEKNKEEKNSFPIVAISVGAVAVAAVGAIAGIYLKKKKK